MLRWSLVKLTECTPRALAVPAASVAKGRLHRKNPHQESCAREVDAVLFLLQITGTTDTTSISTQ